MGSPVNFYSSGGLGTTIDTILYCPFEADYTDLTGRHTMVSVGTTTINQSTFDGVISLQLNTGAAANYSEVNHLVVAGTSTVDFTDFSLGTADFVIDSFIKLSHVPTLGDFYGEICGFGTKYGPGPIEGNWSFQFFNNFGGDGYELGFEYNHFYRHRFETFNVVANSWYRASLIRQSSTLTCYLNGVQLGSTGNIGTISLGTTTSGKYFYIGGEDSQNNGAVGNIDSFPGWIDYVYIAKNVTTLPSGNPINFYASGGLGTTTDTVLYLPLETDYTDLTGRHTFTTVGSVSIVSDSYIGTGSMLLSAPTGPGQNSNIGTVLMSATTLNHLDFSLGTADFVIDCAVRLSSLLTNGGNALDVISCGTKYNGAFPTGGTWYIYLFGGGGGESWSFRFGYTTTGAGSQFENIFPTISGGTFTPHFAGYDLGGGVEFDGWYRLTVIRSGTTLNLHLSGAEFDNDIESYSIGTVDFGTASDVRLRVGGEYMPHITNVNTVSSFGRSGGPGHIDSWLGNIDYVLINKNVSEFPNKPINFYSRP